MVARTKPVAIASKIKPRPDLKEWRCPSCGKLLLRLSCPEGTPIVIETRCTKCGASATLERAA